MNLKNKSTGRTMNVPPGESEDESEVYVGPLWIREGKEPLLSESEILRRAEIQRKHNEAMEEIARAGRWTLLWILVSAAIVIGAGAWVVQYMRDVFAVKP